jgi:hypothetical protein
MMKKQERILSDDSFIELAYYVAMVGKIAKANKLDHKDPNLLVNLIKETYQIEAYRRSMAAQGGCCGGNGVCSPSKDILDLGDADEISDSLDLE